MKVKTKVLTVVFSLAMAGYAIAADEAKSTQGTMQGAMDKGAMMADKGSAMMDKGAAMMDKAMEENAMMNNKICPISGEKIDPAKQAKIVYKDKTYNLCCGMCVKDFNKDPEAAIKKLEAAAAAEKPVVATGTTGTAMKDMNDSMKGATK